MIDLDADSLEVSVGFQRVVDPFPARARLLTASEGHVQASNQPTVLPDGANLIHNKKKGFLVQYFFSFTSYLAVAIQKLKKAWGRFQKPLSTKDSYIYRLSQIKV